VCVRACVRLAFCVRPCVILFYFIFVSVYMVLMHLKDKMESGEFLMFIREAPGAYSLYMQVVGYYDVEYCVIHSFTVHAGNVLLRC